MDNYLYLLINMTSILIPFIFSFYPKTSFFTTWKKLFPGYIIMTAIYLIWDIIFTRMGIWGFNDDYLIGIKIFFLPNRVSINIFPYYFFFICSSAPIAISSSRISSANAYTR